MKLNDNNLYNNDTDESHETYLNIAPWSSWLSRQSFKLETPGSNPAGVTNYRYPNWLK